MKIYSKHLFFIILILSGFNIFSNEQHVKKNKIVVTGGGGFIGSHVVEALISRGDSVVIIDNLTDISDVRVKEKTLSEFSKKYNKQSLSIYKSDILDKKNVRKIFKKERPDMICHLAAKAGVRPSVENPELYVNNNILGTLYMLDMAKEFNIKNFIFASSSSVYGQSNATPFSEKNITDFPASPYAATKKSAELLLYAYHSLYKIPCTVLRFFTVYGPRGRLDMAPFLFLDAIYRQKQFNQYGDGTSIRDFTYIDDIVQGIIKAIDKAHDFEIFNLARGEPVAVRDLISTIEKVTGKKAIINQLPSVSGDVQATHGDISNAERLLGYKPKISLYEGMSRLYKWYKEHYIPLIEKK